jgi:hypothetical protein
LCIPGGGNIRRATDEELHRRRLLRRGFVLEYVTLGWTAITAAVVFALVFGRPPTGAALGNPVLAAGAGSPWSTPSSPSPSSPSTPSRCSPAHE